MYVKVGKYLVDINVEEFEFVTVVLGFDRVFGDILVGRVHDWDASHLKLAPSDGVSPLLLASLVDNGFNLTLR